MFAILEARYGLGVYIFAILEARYGLGVYIFVILEARYGLELYIFAILQDRYGLGVYIFAILEARYGLGVCKCSWCGMAKGLDQKIIFEPPRQKILGVPPLGVVELMSSCHRECIINLHHRSYDVGYEIF